MYAWLLFAHIVSVAGFLLAHGTSAAMALRLRSEKTTDGIRSLTELSKLTSGVMYSFIALIVISGVFFGFQGRWWGRAWIWAALALLIVTMGAMSALGGRFNAVRGAVGLPAGTVGGRSRRHRPGRRTRSAGRSRARPPG